MHANARLDHQKKRAEEGKGRELYVSFQHLQARHCIFALKKKKTCIQYILERESRDMERRERVESRE